MLITVPPQFTAKSRLNKARNHYYCDYCNRCVRNSRNENRLLSCNGLARIPLIPQLIPKTNCVFSQDRSEMYFTCRRRPSRTNRGLSDNLSASYFFSSTLYNFLISVPQKSFYVNSLINFFVIIYTNLCIDCRQNITKSTVNTELHPKH